jgi:hypothetical protein
MERRIPFNMYYTPTDGSWAASSGVGSQLRLCRVRKNRSRDERYSGFVLGNSGEEMVWSLFCGP